MCESQSVIMSDHVDGLLNLQESSKTGPAVL